MQRDNEVVMIKAQLHWFGRMRFKLVSNFDRKD